MTKQRGKSLSRAVIAYLGLGANLGNREMNIALALALLSKRVNIEKVSSLYESEPVGYLQQRKFLNAVCRVRTSLSPTELLDYSQRIERALGRRRSFRNAPRPIDIDILLYGRRIVNTKRLVVPHPRMAERAFVLVPLAEIAPRLVHPETRKTIASMAAHVAGKEGVVKWKALSSWPTPPAQPTRRRRGAPRSRGG